MQRYICIHGHFYQPPRENPWLDAVETQDSARPYHDWNERVTAESYGPNAMSRILDEKDAIVRIVNNYSRISFNVGPTLLSWMEASAPEIYDAILEADRNSIVHFSGHGSAIAQAYNHMILPLSNQRDQRTQVRWGIADFERRFKRFPEGMWLPETAVDTSSLEMLAAEGIRYTILEPGQARKIRRFGNDAPGEWADMTGGRIDPSRAYRVNLPSGRSIAVFFYDGPISRAVAFERLLARGEFLAGRLLSVFAEGRDWSQLVNISTDGETYGHHHRHGDMALAYALETIENGNAARLTNYGEYLEKHPPEWEVEIVEATSWSCAHGIERWRSDCGCSTGGDVGWNQQWRGPLRLALDHLRDAAGEIYEIEARRYFRDPWAARDLYVAVVIERTTETIDRFFASNCERELTKTERIVALELCEMQRHAMLMYTSCGWFFNELSGIETVQVLQYAGRVCQLAAKLSGRDVETPFLELLSVARSNIPEKGSGRDIYNRYVVPTALDLGRVAAHQAVRSMFEEVADEEDVYSYRLSFLSRELNDVGRARVAAGQLRVVSRITEEESIFTYGLLDLGDVHLAGAVARENGVSHLGPLLDRLRAADLGTDFPVVLKAIEETIGPITINIRSLFRDEQRRIVAQISRNTLEEAEAAFRQLHERYLPLLKLHSDLTIPLPKALAVAAEFDLNLQMQRAFDREDFPLTQIESLIRQAEGERVTLDETTLFVLERRIARLVQLFSKTPDDLELLKKLERAVDLVVHMKWNVDLWAAQNTYYRMMQTLLPDFRMFDERGDVYAHEWIETFKRLGDDLRVKLGADA